MHTYRFSIIIPVYNVASELSRAVDSVRTQDYTNWEVVLVDDGSTDGSSQLCDKFSHADTRIICVHQENAGVVAARENGFRRSTGEYVLFLDGDDALANGLLKRLATLLGEQESDMVHYGFDMGRDMSSMASHRPLFPPGHYLVKDLIRQIKRTPLEITAMCLWDKAYRAEIVRRAFDQVGGVRIKHSEDGLFALAALLHCQTYHSLPEIGYHYILRDGSAVCRYNADLADEKDLFVDAVDSVCRESGLFSQEQINQIVDAHSFESASFIFYRLLQWRLPFRNIYSLSKSVGCSRFIQRSRLGATSPLQRVVLFVVRRPVLMAIVAKLYMVKRFLCQKKH